MNDNNPNNTDKNPARDLACSLMERQDRMNEEIFYQINDLRYQLEDLEQTVSAAGGG